MLEANKARIALFGALFLASCVGDIGSSPKEQTPSRNDPIDPIDPVDPIDPIQIPEVPVSIELLPATATCSALGAGETILDVSAEGHLWLATSSVTAQVRVLDGWDSNYQAHYELAFDAIQNARVLTATTAAFIADGALWFVENGERLSISAPDVLRDGATLCGDPSKRAFVLSAGTLFERSEDEWLEWTGLESAFAGGATLLSRDGECAGTDDRLWIVSGGEGELAFWELTPVAVKNPALLAGAHHASLLRDRPLALKDGDLFVGPEPWAQWSFGQGEARVLAAAGAYAWILAGEQLLRYDGEHFLRVELPVGTAVSALHPHASGGIWLAASTTSTTAGNFVCHVAPDPMLRVAGLRNGEQRTDAAFVLRTRATEEDMNVVARIDGVDVEPTSINDGWFTFTGTLALGWHTVQISAPDNKAVRELAVKRVPATGRSFESDIFPIYQASCTGSECHVANSTAGAPDLSSYEAWISRSSKIRDRVVRAQDMPPLASRGPTWSQEQVAFINEWLNGGMRP